MALNPENLAKHKAQSKRSLIVTSLEDRLSIPNGDIQDLLMVILPPLGLKNGELETYPNQVDGELVYMRSVHGKVGNGQQTCECLSNWGEDCELCIDSRKKQRFTPYVILVKETDRGYIPLTKPVVADFPASLGDTIVSDMGDKDKLIIDDLSALPVYKYSRIGSKLDTKHTLTQRPSNHTFDISRCLYLDKIVSDGVVTYKISREPNNPVFSTKDDIREYLKVVPKMRLYKPSFVRVRAARLGLDLKIRDEALKELVSVGDFKRGNQSAYSFMQSETKTEDKDTSIVQEAGDTMDNDFDDDPIPF